MTQLTNPATHDHPNFVRAQAASDAARLGDYGPTFDMLAEEIILENGPGAGPWHIARGKEDMALGSLSSPPPWATRSARTVAARTPTTA